MNIKGTLLRFGVENKNHMVVSKDCKIHIPDVMPIVRDYNFINPNKVIGWCEVYRDDDGLTIFGTLNHQVTDVEVGTGLGGYFTNVISTINIDGERTIESVQLKACSITNEPANDEYIITEVTDDKSREV